MMKVGPWREEEEEGERVCGGGAERVGDGVEREKGGLRKGLKRRRGVKKKKEDDYKLF